MSENKTRRQGFQFKQFFVEHSRCAMKVGTDSIMLGSWIEPQGAATILDIGCGSGVLALMLAQKSAEDCQIVGVDIDALAVEQANLNRAASPWPDKLAFAQLAVQQLAAHPHLPQQYQLIVSNPPYFAVNHTANRLQQHERAAQRIQARQTSALDHASLLESVCAHLADDGYFYCVIPADVADGLVTSAAALGLHLQQQLQVRSKPQAKISRLLLKLGRYSVCTQINQLTIYTEQQHYSQDYIDLCKAYYLRF